LKISVNKGELTNRSFESFLFNSPQLFHQQRCDDYSVLNLLDENENCLARCAVFFKDNQAYSPFRAPFGSIELSDNITIQELEYFIEELEKFLRERRATKFKIVSYPECYVPEKASLLNYCLLKQNYSIITAELNYHLSITSSSDIVSVFHDSERRRYKKCMEQGFEVGIERGSYVQEAFELIKKGRESKGIPLSMKLEEFQKLFKEYSQYYLLFTVKDKNKLVAVATGVKVSSEILYYFLPADDAEYKSFSPTVLLIKGMYDYCKENNIRLLDLGIATADAVPNYGLIKFKEHLGGIPSLKYTFQKTLE